MADDSTPESAHTPLLQRDTETASTLGPASSSASLHQEAGRNGSEKHRDVIRYTAFASAIFSCLCGGSIMGYSLYGHLFQERLRYTQLQVNVVSIAAELAQYLPVPLFGYFCDRVGPAPLSLFAGVLFGVGYTLAALTYRSGVSSHGESTRDTIWPFPVMVVAFAFIGMATVAMYMSAVTTCAKNFGRGKYKGLALALPMAAFGLSGMWQSQVGSRVFYETRPDGSHGDVDVFTYFMFLAAILLVAGLIGVVALKVVDEDILIEEAVEELERSGLLEDSAFFRRDSIRRDSIRRDYGSFGTQEENIDNDTASSKRLAEEAKARAEDDAQKKIWLLNQETRRFLKDRTMWYVTAGLFLVTGPGDAFLNNLGTIIGTLYPPSTDPSIIPTTAATHVSIVAIASTVSRILTGTLTDWLAPVSIHRHQASRSNSISSLHPQNSRFTLSRVVFLIAFALLMSVGQVLLASGFIQNHGERFWIVTALMGSGYGAVFSLVPLIISVIWGVENFGTNWGIVAMVPALGATVWGVIYSTVYQRAANALPREDLVEDILCYGVECYSQTFWAMAISVWVACGLWIWAWKGTNGWSRRGIAV